jgi:hypothetical protein
VGYLPKDLQRGEAKHVPPHSPADDMNRVRADIHPEQDYSARAFAIASEVLLMFPSPPLLYRWKHFEPALAFADRNLNFHGLLLTVLELTVACSGDISPEDLMQEWEDMTPATKQQIRAQKTIKFFQDGACRRMKRVQTGTMTIYTEAKIKRIMARTSIRMHLQRAKNTSCVCRIRF